MPLSLSLSLPHIVDQQQAATESIRSKLERHVVATMQEMEKRLGVTTGIAANMHPGMDGCHDYACNYFNTTCTSVIVLSLFFKRKNRHDKRSRFRGNTRSCSSSIGSKSA